MIITGGVYREDCITPAWSRIFGSGGRAAAAVSTLSPGSILHAYAARAWADDVRRSMEAFAVTAEITEIERDIAFTYFHPLSDAELSFEPGKRESSLQVAGEAVLRFGFVEGDAVVTADRVVYDPQHWDEVLRFGENGSRAGRLAIVLNETELALSTGLTGPGAVEYIRNHSGAEVVVVKRGPRGAIVYEGGNTTIIPAYKSESVFKIGSGDVFSAIFAHYWGERREPAAVAAQAASRAVARYVATRNVQASLEESDVGAPAPTKGPFGPIYLAAPFFNLGQRWVVEEARRVLLALGAKVFSPLHDIGSTGSAVFIAEGDLEGLRRCRGVLAILDGEDAGTLFEVGYAASRAIPVVALAESPRPEALTMVAGTGGRITDDFTTAIYHAIWSSMA
jgi:nucleoside 2-deoxyribosyltransferase